MKNSVQDVENAKTFLARLGDTPEIVTIIIHVSQSGVQRRLSVLGIVDGKIERISWAVAAATGLRLNRDEQTIVINGCGFSAAHEIADSLTHSLGVKVSYREL